MFSLSAADLDGTILGVGDGPASFNCELTRRGGRIVSIDPLYQFTAAEIQGRIAQTYDRILEQTRSNLDEFTWEHITSVDELGQIRMQAMNLFLDDFPNGGDRYRAGELPELPFMDREFDLSLCSHFLFLYSEQFDAGFHVRSLRELCRVAREARVFPLLELGSQPSRHLDAVVAGLREAGYRCDIETVAYEFQKGGDRMLRVAASED